MHDTEFHFITESDEDIIGENSYELVEEFAMPYVYLQGEDYETIVEAALIRYPLHGPEQVNAFTWINPPWPKGEEIVISPTIFYDDFE